MYQIVGPVPLLKHPLFGGLNPVTGSSGHGFHQALPGARDHETIVGVSDWLAISLVINRKPQFIMNLIYSLFVRNK
jgi:hypothetical protein